MKLVVLGLKHKEDGSLHVYDTISRKQAHVPVDIGDTIPACPVSPFPFSHFSSLDYSKGFLDTYLPTYLLVEADVTEDELNGMSSGSIVTYQFDSRTVTVLSESDTPFAYALEQLGVHGDRLGTYPLTTWVIHETARSQREFDAMCEILKISIEEHAKTDYTLDLSLDTHVLGYLDFLGTFPDESYTFGRYGRNVLTKEDIQSVPISDDALLMLIEKTNLLSVLVHHPRFDVSFYQTYIQTDQTLEEAFLRGLYRDECAALSSISFDMDVLFERFYMYWMSTGRPDYSEHDDRLAFVSDDTYKPVKQTYNPYEYYCCSDCDGYDLDADDQPYDYYVDEQVDCLTALVSDWDNYLTARSLPLFDAWDEKIFERYSKEHPDSSFAQLLTEAKEPERTDIV